MCAQGDRLSLDQYIRTNRYFLFLACVWRPIISQNLITEMLHFFNLKLS